ncbi:MerR family transcriptional regulator [Streptomyces sp. 891-h]|uniref:MerR family transcriptional regulator n=1 Tax=Streptomyces sp. 891-h TaxID=2720714 RepID=UPI001FAAB7D4|nr:MerR family transcriptional regulator [Streptomyces sp. 891-h]UNZ16593.1 MerR family transcriptional regulator [Streptomyces sp. 891-h]
MGTAASPQGRRTLRSVDLARAAGISTQQVRNYEEDGILPPADRTPSGYRLFTERHRAALLTYRALVKGYGLDPARRMLHAVHAGDVAAALALVNEGHAILHEQRRSLRMASEALTATAEQAPEEAAQTRAVLRIGELAHQLGVRRSALRVWESAGLLTPRREPVTGYRSFGPAEIRDARLIALLRQSRYPLPQIRTVLDGLRETGSTAELRAALARRAQELTTRTTAMLEGSGLLHAYLRDHGHDRPGRTTNKPDS